MPGECTLTVYDDVPHCWQMLSPFVPEAVDSLQRSSIDPCIQRSSSTVTTDGRLTVVVRSGTRFSKQ
jgi:hypothetical protein